jgi:hypothetical protein
MRLDHQPLVKVRIGSQLSRQVARAQHLDLDRVGPHTLTVHEGTGGVDCLITPRKVCFTPNTGHSLGHR